MKYCLPFNLLFWVLYKYTRGQCNSSYYGETDRNLKVRLQNIMDTTSKGIAICDHLLILNKVSSFEEFTVLAYRYHKYILEIKESLMIKHDRHVLNKNISSDKLLPFDNNYNFQRFYCTVILFYHVAWYVSYGLSHVSHDTVWNRIEKKLIFFNVRHFVDNDYSNTRNIEV